MKRCVLYSLLLVLLSVQGCNIVGAAAHVFSPPPLIEARYKLPDKKTLIVIDDPNVLIESPAITQRIALATRTALEVEQVVTAGFVSQNDLNALRESLGPEYKSTSLAGLGIALDAKQVIHVEVLGYQMQVAAGVVRPVIGLQVRVFDLDQRARVFPGGVDPDSGVDLGQAAYPVTTRLAAEDFSEADAARARAARELADKAGRDIARLFFDWRMPEPGANLGER